MSYFWNKSAFWSQYIRIMLCTQYIRHFVDKNKGIAHNYTNWDHKSTRTTWDGPSVAGLSEYELFFMIYSPYQKILTIMWIIFNLLSGAGEYQAGKKSETDIRV